MTTRRRTTTTSLRGAALVLALGASLGIYLLALKGLFPKPFGTPMQLVEAPLFRPASPPSSPQAMRAGEVQVRLAFVGDIMQHREQMQDDFFKSYAVIAPFLKPFDLVVGNLEFPVDPDRPTGSPPGSVQFNGSARHLRALAAAGFDILVTANNHAFDQGLNGAVRTVEEVTHGGMVTVGTGATRELAGPKLVDAKGTKIAIAAYTFRPNSYPDRTGKVAYWHRDWPIYELNFQDWTREYRQEGRTEFKRHVEAARRQGAQLVIAYVHWGIEWHLDPTEDQRRAARDMIDAGFDLVVGTHPHVLNPPEIYKGKLIAYSLGDFLTAFRPLQARTGAVLEVEMRVDSQGAAALRNFRYWPVVTEHSNLPDPTYQVTPASAGAQGDQARAYGWARRILGSAAVADWHTATVAKSAQNKPGAGK